MALLEIPSPGIPLEYGVQGDPLVIFVHDWYGRLPALEADGRALAYDGFHVLIPDLYNGWATTDETDAAGLVDRLDLTVAVNAIGRLARGGRAAGAPRVGLIGFALGGWLALEQAQAGSVDAVVAYYATLNEAEDGVLPCPVQLHFAEVDGLEESWDPDSFVERLTDYGTSVERYDYLGTEHSFANASIPSKLATDAAELAFARTATFLEKHLAD